MKFASSVPAWIKNLKVGDQVCDCRFKHIAIKTIEYDSANVIPWIVRKIIFNDYLPFKLTNLLEDGWDYLCHKLEWREIHDLTLILEDGSSCSAKHCCNSVPHDWEHPTQEELDLK